ncbi:MAG: DUF2905 domain-containing protein [Anaerolineales bacterium]
MSLLPFARLLIIIGLVFLITGSVIYLAVRVGIPFFNLPGDFKFQWGNFRCVFALGTSILLSILATIGLNILLRILNR